MFGINKEINGENLNVRKERQKASINTCKAFGKSEVIRIAGNTRYGHRWCNVVMTDHSVDETVEFMRAVIEAHEKFKA
ncbi:MAG: hypothetical protein ACP5KW_08495 [Thermoproteota archaeon]